MPQSTTGLLKGVKIVWIEDDRFLSDMIARRVADTGALLIPVTDGAKAFDTVKTNKPDVVMLDLMIPNVSGFEVLRLIKADPEIKTIPVIVLSNLSQEAEIKKVTDLGAEKFMVKAVVGLDEILPEIAKVIHRA